MISQLKDIARQFLKPPLHKADVDIPFRVLGTDYGGWPIAYQNLPQSPVIFSVGVGEDISFDLAAIDQFGAQVHAFDPTPRSRIWIESQRLPESFRFYPVGLAGEDGEAEFFAPENDAYVSFSAQPARHSDRDKMVRAPVHRMAGLMALAGTDVPDLLKMDIEGFEYAVIDDLLHSQILPRQMMIEFHHRMYDIENKRTIDAVEKIRNNGYRLFYVSKTGHEYGFIRT